MSEIDIRLELEFGASAARAFTLEVNTRLPGRGISAIYGASGSGKTTLLRCIAGLEQARGDLVVNGTTWQNDTTYLPVHQRPLGYVFQDANLFAHLTVQGNLDYALKRRTEPETPDQFQHVLEVLGIGQLLGQPAAALSGGEQQRVAIARALLIQPRLLLMDEPLASLDTARKQEILPYLEAVHAEFELPILYVSHAVEEVSRLADHIVVLDEGKVAAAGPAAELLAAIGNPLDAGDDTGVIIGASVVERDADWHLIKAQFSGGSLWLSDNGEAVGASIRIRILARDVSLALAEHTDTSILNRLPATVTDIQTAAEQATALVQLAAGDERLLARLTRRSLSHLGVQKGAQVWVQVKSAAVMH